MPTQDFLSEYIKVDELKTLEVTLSHQLSKVRRIISFLTEDDNTLLPAIAKASANSLEVNSQDKIDNEARGDAKEAQEPSQLVLSGSPQSSNAPRYSTLIPLFFREHNSPIKSSDLVDYFYQHHNPSKFDRKKVAGMIFPALTVLYSKQVLRRDKDGFVHPI